MESRTSDISGSTDTAYTIVPPTQNNPTAELRSCLEAMYEARLLEKAGRFTLCIQELGLLVHDKSLDGAYAKLKQAREQRIMEYASEDLLAWLPRPGAAGTGAQPGGSEPRLLVRLRPFLIKAAIVSALFLWAMNMVNDSARNIGYGLEKKLDGLANMSAESIEKNRAKSALNAEKLGPIVRELAVMFRDQPRSEAKPGAVGAGTGMDAANATQGQLSSTLTKGQQ